MKICMIALEHAVDDDRVYHKEALTLSKFSYKVSIIGLKGKTKVKLRHVKLIYSRIRNITLALELALRERADVYHVHDYTSLIIGFIIKILRPKIKLIYDIHEYNLDILPMAKSVKRKLWLIFMYKLFETIALKFVNVLIVADENIKKLYRKSEKPILILHNYVKLQYFNFKQYENNQIDPSKLNVKLVYVGGISKDRGVEFIAKIAETFKHSELHITILLVGPLIERNLNNFIKYLQSLNNVKYLGVVPHEDVPRYIANAHIGLILFKQLPKYQKNIPTKLFEYVALGKPIISTYLLPACRYISKNKWGVCIQYGDIKAFKHALANLITSYKYYKYSCLKTIYNYLWEKESIKLIKLYKNIMNSKGDEY